jgi:aryl-alcohol dehydrogenase-like predicted oxidoreductase
MKSRWSRREFLKTTTAAMMLGAAEKALGAAAPQLPLLPKRRLGKTGEMVSIIGFGLGSRFCSIPDEDAAQALLERALALGINYFDTAGSYTRRPLERLSEKRLGEFSKGRRKDMFLATKIDPRDRDGALRSVETSLKFLQTDYLDLIQIHSLSNLNDLDRIGGPDGVIAAIQELKDQKLPASSALPATTTARPWRRRYAGTTSIPF